MGLYAPVMITASVVHIKTKAETDQELQTNTYSTRTDLFITMQDRHLSIYLIPFKSNKITVPF